MVSNSVLSVCKRLVIEIDVLVIFVSSTMGRASAGPLNGAGPTCRLILTMQRLNGDAEHWRTSPHRRPAGRPWALRDSLHVRLLLYTL